MGMTSRCQRRSKEEGRSETNWGGESTQKLRRRKRNLYQRSGLCGRCHRIAGDVKCWGWDSGSWQHQGTGRVRTGHRRVRTNEASQPKRSTARREVGRSGKGYRGAVTNPSLDQGGGPQGERSKRLKFDMDRNQGLGLTEVDT